MTVSNNNLSLRERNKLRTRQELKSAALQVFAEEGFAGSSVDKIAKVAGTSKGTAYVYFPEGLDDIYREIYIDLSEGLLEDARERRAEETTPDNRILALGEALLELSSSREHGAFYSLLSPEMRPVLASVLGKGSKEYMQMLSEDLHALKVAGQSAEKTGEDTLALLIVGAFREAAKTVSANPRKKKQMLAGIKALVTGLLASGNAENENN